MPDLHPIFVHFPIALFTIYALLEILPVKKLQATTTFTYIKGTMVIIGSFFSVFTLITGNIAGEALEHDPFLGDVVELHGTFALWTSIVFALLALIYAITFIEINRLKMLQITTSVLWNTILQIRNKVIHRWVLITLAFIGLVLITATGALGGAIVYGSNKDPIMHIMTKLFLNN